MRGYSNYLSDVMVIARPIGIPTGLYPLKLSKYKTRYAILLLGDMQIGFCKYRQYLRAASEVIMKKTLHIILTIVIMLIVSRFAVRIVDATVQIDGKIFALSLFLAAVNALIVIVSYKLYKYRNR